MPRFSAKIPGFISYVILCGEKCGEKIGQPHSILKMIGLRDSCQVARFGRKHPNCPVYFP